MLRSLISYGHVVHAHKTNTWSTNERRSWLRNTA